MLRGVHWHDVHADYLTVVDGRWCWACATCGPARRARARRHVLVLTADEPAAVEIPPGVAHGFWFPEASIHVYAVSHYWDPADERGVRWDDPQLAIPWPAEADAAAPVAARRRAAGARRGRAAAALRAARAPLATA